jgi:hypothetical protein
VADEDVGVVEDAREVRGCLVEDARLLARRGGAVDGRALGRDEVVERDRGEEGRLPLPARKERHKLALRAGRGFRYPPLEGLEGQADLVSEPLELHESVVAYEVVVRYMTLVRARWRKVERCGFSWF